MAAGGLNRRRALSRRASSQSGPKVFLARLVIAISAGPTQMFARSPCKLERCNSALTNNHHKRLIVKHFHFGAPLMVRCSASIPPEGSLQMPPRAARERRSDLSSWKMVGVGLRGERRPGRVLPGPVFLLPQKSRAASRSDSAGSLAFAGFDGEQTRGWGGKSGGRLEGRCLGHKGSLW